MRAAVVVTLTIGLLAGCAAEHLHRDGLAAIDQGHYQEGIAMLEQAAQSDPNNATYRLDLKARREAVVQRMIATADAARHAGQLDEADALYRAILGIESGNNRAQRGIDGVAADRRHADLVAQAEAELGRGEIEQAEAKVNAVLAENPGFESANALRTRIDDARGPVNVVPRLHPRDNHAVTLQFRDANTKMVFEVLSRQTGINFIFDKDVRSDGKTTIFVQDVPIEQAIELVLGQNQLARQVLSENMVLIYPKTPQKQKDYQDQIVKTFYLTNADPKEVAEPAEDRAQRQDAVRRRARQSDRHARYARNGAHGGEAGRLARPARARGHDGGRGARDHAQQAAAARHQLSDRGHVLDDGARRRQARTSPTTTSQNSDTITATPLSVSVDLPEDRSASPTCSRARASARATRKRPRS